MTITIKPFEKKYLEGVLQLIEHIQHGEFNFPLNEEQHQELSHISTLYQTGLGNYWVALNKEEVIGTMAVRDIGHESLALKDVFVHESYRGAKQGVAKNLLDTILSWSQTHGIKTIYLGTASCFLAAHRFYAKHGFIEIPKKAVPPYVVYHVADTKFFKYDMKAKH